MKRTQRIDDIVAMLVRQWFGKCPACSTLNGNSMGALMDCNRAAIYRRSRRSVTLRCHFCRLQWTLTWVQINRSLRYLAQCQHGPDLKDVEYLIRATDFAVEREQRGRAAAG